MAARHCHLWSRQSLTPRGATPISLCLHSLSWYLSNCCCQRLLYNLIDMCWDCISCDVEAWLHSFGKTTAFARIGSIWRTDITSSPCPQGHGTWGMLLVSFKPPISSCTSFTVNSIKRLQIDSDRCLISLVKYRIRELFHVFNEGILFDSQRLIFQYVCANGSIFVQHCVTVQSCMHSTLEASIEYP